MIRYRYSWHLIRIRLRNMHVGDSPLTCLDPQHWGWSRTPAPAPRPWAGRSRGRAGRTWRRCGRGDPSCPCQSGGTSCWTPSERPPTLRTGFEPAERNRRVKGRRVGNYKPVFRRKNLIMSWPTGCRLPPLSRSDGRYESVERGYHPPLPTGIRERYCQTISKDMQRFCADVNPPPPPHKQKC